jgi:hypothetical protein
VIVLIEPLISWLDWHDWDFTDNFAECGLIPMIISSSEQSPICEPWNSILQSIQSCVYFLFWFTEWRHCIPLSESNLVPLHNKSGLSFAFCQPDKCCRVIICQWLSRLKWFWKGESRTKRHLELECTIILI